MLGDRALLHRLLRDVDRFLHVGPFDFERARMVMVTLDALKTLGR